ncbi:uncharacterized protein LOC131063424 [Cryptomeria japonica]|uniref:uncharacterized protein LOC131063424 n=1 Tax=Cryptomeria japonica TaxID=3369 RepID=UPI0025AC24C0|nr:uncharacterized protein LOC131063424 [Cryptomeria japonica]
MKAFEFDCCNSPIIHATSLIDFWRHLGRPSTKAPPLQIAWQIGPTFLLLQVWLEINRWIFQGHQHLIVQENLMGKCSSDINLAPVDITVIQCLQLGYILENFVSLSRTSLHHSARRINRDGHWTLPLCNVLKINIDGSSCGNLGPAGIGGVGRDNNGAMQFFFSMETGFETNNPMAARALLFALQQALELQWNHVICELDSMILVSLLVNPSSKSTSWQLSSLVAQIRQISSCFSSISFTHIPCEWNRVLLIFPVSGIGLLICLLNEHQMLLVVGMLLIWILYQLIKLLSYLDFVGKPDEISLNAR